MRKSTSGEKATDHSFRSLNYGVLGIIAVLIIAYQVSLFLTADEPGYNFTDTIYLITIGPTACFGIIIAKMYHGAKIFGNAYLFLGIGFIAMLVGDLAFYYHEYVLEVDPYPSPFDIAFLIANVGVIAHLTINARFFKPRWSIKDKLLLMIIPILVTSIYITTAFLEWGEYDELSFDIFWGSLFVAGSSTTLAFAILGASIFDKGELKEV